jgi:DNA end-binding protein Ku
MKDQKACHGPFVHTVAKMRARTRVDSLSFFSCSCCRARAVPTMEPGYFALSATHRHTQHQVIVMAARSSWKGFLRLSLVSIPVKAYTATTSGGGEISLNQIHRDCNTRIKYQKVCPIHGELSSDEIVSGYEIAKGQYVVIDPDELDKLRSESDKAIHIDAFVPPGRLDPVYFTGKNYYLVPDGPVAFKPYALLVAGMTDQKAYGVAKVVMHSKDQVVLLRPLGHLLTMSILNFESQVVKPADFEKEVPQQELSTEEVNLVTALIKGVTPKDFDYAQYKDTYTAKLTQLIEAKVQGKEIVTPAPEEQAQVINLMEALKASVSQLKAEESAEAKPPKRAAKSAPKPPEEKKKKKSS